MSEYSRLMDEAEEHAAAFKLKSSLAEKVASEIKELEDELLRMDQSSNGDRLRHATRPPAVPYRRSGHAWRYSNKSRYLGALAKLGGLLFPPSTFQPTMLDAPSRTSLPGSNIKPDGRRCCTGATPDRSTGGAVGAKTTQKTVNAACKGTRMRSGAPDANQNYCANLGMPTLYTLWFLV